MKKLKFKTNINCGGCIQKVTPHLDALENATWAIDTTDENKVLTVEGAEITGQAVIEKVEVAGYHATPLKKGVIHKIFRLKGS